MLKKAGRGGEITQVRKKNLETYKETLKQAALLNPKKEIQGKDGSILSIFSSGPRKGKNGNYQSSFFKNNG